MSLKGSLGQSLSWVPPWGRTLTFWIYSLFSSLPVPSPGWLATPTTLLLAYDTYFSIHSKTIPIKVIDDEAYEKNKNYFIEMMGPRMVDMSLQKGVVPCPPH